ncbi:MAG TPA: sulfite exporter TauE/SafE family protein [Gaiellaceae bacterium]|nr:sulfite exporter TauE/SafE family protein [Gaiellaceae bacterium]
MTWQFTLTGLLIGVLVGLTGMGGGSLMTPILVIVFGFKPTYAVGTDILHGAVFKSFGAVRHRRLGNVHAHLVLWMFLGSGPMSLLGVATAGWLARAYGDSVQSALSYAIGGALILGAIGLVLKTFVKRGVQPSEAGFVMQRRDKVLAVIIGAVFGYIVGLTSVGSGTFFGLVMVMIYPLTIARIVGTDIFHAAALLWVAGFGHLVQGNVDLHAMAWLLLGSIPGIWISSRFTLHLPQDALRLGLAGVLALSGIKLLNVPQSSYVIAVGLGLGLGALAVWLFLQSRSREAERADDSRTGLARADGDGVRGDAALEARAEPDLADARR